MKVPPRPSTQALTIRTNRQIGLGTAPYVIAEIGTNHNRDLETARRLIREVARTGCDCAKFQIYEPEEIVSANVRARDYGLDKLYGDISATEMFARHLQTPKAWFPELRDLCHELGLDFAATIHGDDGLRWAKSIEPDIIKIASMDHNNLPFLRNLVNEVNAPILISFGMAVLDDIDAAIEILKLHRHGVGAFHCVAVYPPRHEEMRLANIGFMQSRYEVPIGLSDHTEDAVSAIAAAALGAVVFEKHVTLDRKQAGPDHPFAFEPDMLGNYVEYLRRAHESLGTQNFTPPPARELVNRAAYLKSLIAARDFPAGHRLSRGDIYLARPGTGIPAKDLDLVIGHRLTRGVAADDVLATSDVEGYRAR